jgi:hypothetical protein
MRTLTGALLLRPCQIQFAEKSALNPLPSALKRTETH